MSKERVTKWIDRQKIEITSKGSPSYVCLYHENIDNHIERLDRHPLDQDTEDIVQVIYEAANANSESYPDGRPQRYLIRSYYESDGDDGEVSASMRFLVQAVNTEYTLKAGETEPGNEKGAFAQFMRHQEVMMKLLLGNAEHSMTRMQRENESYARREENVMQMRMTLHDKMEELKDRTSERELKKESERAKAARAEKMIGVAAGMGKMLLPQLLAKATGTPRPEAQAMGREGALKELVETLNADQIQEVFAALEPQQVAILMEIIQSYQASESETPKSSEETSN